MLQVSPERTGHRDDWISNRHRDVFGFGCPMVDVDFCAIEFDMAEPVAFIDYKHKNVRSINFKSVGLEALIKVADRYHIPIDGRFWHFPLPVMIVVYNPDEPAYQIIPLNDAAKKIYGHVDWLVYSEYEYIDELYRLRNNVRRIFNPQAGLARNDRPHLASRTCQWQGWSPG